MYLWLFYISRYFLIVVTSANNISNPDKMPNTKRFEVILSYPKDVES